MVLSLLPDLGKRTLVMGILNVTPDSFSDGGRFATIDTALSHARHLTDEGADILDVGGESTRPGATEVSVGDEIARVVPVIERLAAGEFPPVSIDTYKAATAEAALKAGAAIVNDVWGLQREPDIALAAAAHGAPVIVMHNRADVDPTIDIIEDMKRFFGHSLDIARKAGVPDDHVILDPGVGFGKTLEQNLQAVARVGELKALGYPVLMGTIAQADDRCACRCRTAGCRTASRHRRLQRRRHPGRRRYCSRPRRRCPPRRSRRCRRHQEGDAMSDHIRVHRLAVFARHGVLAEEATIGQRFFISLDASVDTRAAGASDDLTKSVSYADMADVAVGIATARRFNLLEALAEAIATDILGGFPLIEAITVRIDKPSAPVPHVLDSVSVEITRSRANG